MSKKREEAKPTAEPEKPEKPEKPKVEEKPSEVKAPPEEKPPEKPPEVKKPKKRERAAKVKFYRLEGEKLKRLGQTCPRCGPGVFMADHGNRWTCGKCGYTDFKK